MLVRQASPSDQMALCLEFKVMLTEDVIHQHSLTQEHSENLALIRIEDMVIDMGGQLLHAFGLSRTGRENAERTGKDYMRKTNYNTEEERHKMEQNLEKLTPEQMTVFNHIGEQIEQERAGLCFLDAPGGGGKTFLVETILASQRAQNKIAITTASSGLAATLLPGGITVYSTFKVPLNILH